MTYSPENVYPGRNVMVVDSFKSSQWDILTLVRWETDPDKKIRRVVLKNKSGREFIFGYSEPNRTWFYLRPCPFTKRFVFSVRGATYHIA